MLFAIQGMLGFVPNVFAVIAESAPALGAFVELNNRLSASSFDATEREIIQLATSAENRCTYCVAGHTAFAHMQDVSSDVVNAVRNDEPIADPRLEALNQFVRSLVRSGGMVPQSELDEFLDAGYTKAQVLEVILGICVKTFSNLANNVIGIPLDDEFKPFAWQSEPVRRRPHLVREKVA